MPRPWRKQPPTTSNCSRTSPHCAGSRESFAMKENTLPSAERRAQMTKFFWTAWAAATERPNSTVTYTNNWPHEPLISNVPSSENVVWSIASVVILLAGVGFLARAGPSLRHQDTEEVPHLHKILLTVPCPDPVAARPGEVLAPGGRAVCLSGDAGRLHCALHRGRAGVLRRRRLAMVPYPLHPHSGTSKVPLFWIATGFLALGLFLAPVINGWQRPEIPETGRGRAVLGTGRLSASAPSWATIWRLPRSCPRSGTSG